MCQLIDLFFEELIFSLKLLNLHFENLFFIDGFTSIIGFGGSGAGAQVLRRCDYKRFFGTGFTIFDVILNNLEGGAHEFSCQLLFNCAILQQLCQCVTLLYPSQQYIRMSNKFSEAMEQRFMKDLQQMQVNPDDSDHDSEQSDDYYEYQRKRMEAALSLLKTKSNNSILQQLKKNTHNQDDYLDEFQDEVVDLHNITRNNQKNVLHQSVIKQIKEKVFNQSALNTIQLADQELQKKKQKQQIIEIQQKKTKNTQSKQSIEVRETDNRLNMKIQKARMQRQIAMMGRQDQFSMKYQQEMLSDFFKQRFFTPEFKFPASKQTALNLGNYAPKTTFTNLKPIPNTENNVLPRNAPELALRRLGRSKKIKFVPSSMSQVPVKVKKLNPELQQLSVNIKEPKIKNKQQNTQIQICIQNYLKFIKPFIPRIESASKNYRPNFINQFPNQNQQTFNIDNEESQSKSIQDCLNVERPSEIKDIKLTYQHISSLKGIDKFQNVEHASLQFNAISSTNSIQHCRKLIQLNLSHNRIKNIDSLRDLKWLRMLNIEHNCIQNIDLRGGSLEILSASHNRIQEIVDLSSNVYLKSLSVGNNNLHALAGLKNLHYLEEIDAHNNYISDLKGIQQCILLRSLNVCSNRLKQFHPNFTYIFLNKLYASGNSLSQLPSMFLPSLQEMYLNQNKFETLNSSTLYFPSLKVLNLDDNKLSGFCVVWSLIRYSRNLQTLKYDKNEYFLDIREKVKQLYEHIIYKNMNKLHILNQGGFDIGIKKYYEGVYNNYLSSKNMFKPENFMLKQVHKKIIFMIQQNSCMSELEDRKVKFAETNIFVRHKSVTKTEDLIQIIDFLSNKQQIKILHAAKSLFYEHDKYQYGMRNSLHKIKNLLVKKERYLARKKKFYQTKKPNFVQLFKHIQKLIFQIKISKAIDAFHKPLKGMGQQKAAIIIQKNWRCYRLRKQYKKIMAKLRTKKQDSDLQDIDLDDYNFDDMEIPEFNFEVPQDMDFDELIIKPQIFQMLRKREEMREQKREQKKQGKKGKQNENDRSVQPANKGKKMMNNFIQENESRVSESIPAHRTMEQQIARIMQQWHVSKEGAMAIINKQKKKQKQQKETQQKNMTAAERYEKLKRNVR